MRRLLPLLLALLPLPAAAQTDVAKNSANAEPLAAARAFDEAQRNGDAAALDRLIAPDYLVVHGSGRIGGKRDFIATLTRPGTRLDPPVVTDRLFLRVAPDVAIAGGEARTAGMEDGRRFAAHYRYADTFVRRDGRWQALYTQVTPLP